MTPSQSAIYSNEIRDTRSDVLMVKAFKGGTLIEGVYRDIKDRVNVLGGRFNANCYLAFKDGDELKIGAIRFKGAALGAWMDFRKAHRHELFTKAVRIVGFDEGKKGRIVFRTPKFQLADLSSSSNSIATALDKELQAYLRAYLKRRTVEQVEPSDAPEQDFDGPDDDETMTYGHPITDTEIPF